MKILGFLLILAGGALLIIQKYFAESQAQLLNWLAEYARIQPDNNVIVGFSVLAVGVLLMLIGFLAGGRRDI